LIKEKTMATKKIANTAEAWEEGRLGRDEKYAAVADPSHEAALDEALGLQAISIRLPRQLIDQYKLIAHFHGVGYQPLMRDVLSRFVPNALNGILEAEKAKARNVSKRAVLPVSRQKKVA
jgi:predicted DNA binding CopG/RHH family protein